MLLDLINRLLGVHSTKDFKAVLTDVPNVVPCEKVFAGLGKITSKDNLEVILSIVDVSYPAEWLNIYFNKNYATADPILKAHLKTFGSRPKLQLWSDTIHDVASPDEKNFIGEATSFGLGQGMTGGLVDREQNIGSIFSFAGKRMGEHTPHHAVAIEYLLPHLHMAFLRTYSPPVKIKSPLSSREREVLRWLKEGKTSWETSQILNVSERTINFHVQNILVKLHASSRGHAIALAIEQKLIQL